jgi:hypothetical protein
MHGQGAPGWSRGGTVVEAMTSVGGPPVHSSVGPGA